MYKDILTKLKNVLAAFKIDNEWLGFEEVTMGHINNTYKVYTLDKDGVEKSYIVQRVNTNVFTNPLLTMNNIDVVTEHIRNKNCSKALHFHHTLEGNNYYIDGKNFWRLYTFRVGEPCDRYIDPKVMKSCGKAFGEFQNLLSDLDITKLEETIADFHNTQKRYDHFLKTVELDKYNRVKECKDEIEAYKLYSSIALQISNHKDKFPLRVTHNDTKTNNVLVDPKNGEPEVVIDLDTVMPGFIMHDFGDSIRYGANKAKEDEKDLTKVSLSIPLYRAFAEGFIGEIGDKLTEDEINYMALGAVTMTFECGIRFLDDYLDNDQYFKVEYPEHNLVRSRCQLALLKDMLSKLDQMNNIIIQSIKK